MAKHAFRRQVEPQKEEATYPTLDAVDGDRRAFLKRLGLGVLGAGVMGGLMACGDRAVGDREHLQWFSAKAELDAGAVALCEGGEERVAAGVATHDLLASGANDRPATGGSVKAEVLTGELLVGAFDTQAPITGAL